MGKNDERFEFYFDCFVFFYDFCRRIKQRYDSMENTGKIFGISLGPGDPELITLKALKALNAVDVIFCPGTKSGEGRMKSRALDILRQLEVDETKIRLFQVPMSRDRQEALCAYDRVCGEVLELVRSGKSVGITAEGDACFYSSAHYMYGQLAQAGFDRRCTCFYCCRGICRIAFGKTAGTTVGDSRGCDCRRTAGNYSCQAYTRYHESTFGRGGIASFYSPAS